MKKKKELCSLTLASTAIIFLLIGIAGAAPFAYITNTGSGNISIIDTATDSFIKSVDVGSSPYGVAASPNLTKVYVANIDSDNVSVIDTITNEVTGSVDVGNAPFGVALNPDGTKVYVTNRDSNNVSIIDTITNEVTGSVDVGNAPLGVAVSPDGSKVYVTNSASDNVSVIETVSNTVITNVSVGSLPTGVAFNLDGSKAYVTNQNDDNVSVIETVTNTVLYNVSVGDQPDGIAVTPDGSRVYVANRGTNNVTVIDTGADSVLDDVPVGAAPHGVSVTPDGAKVYVANMENNNVSVITNSGLFVLFSVDAGTFPAAFGQFIGGPEPILPVANFSANVTEGYVPLTVQFNDSSTNATSWDWDFGDGDDSIEQNPMHTFTAAENYTVTLTARNVNGTNSTFVNITVLEQPVLPVANFSANVTEGYVPLTVQFNDSSENATEWDWDFGDGDYSTEQNPMHTFSAAGNYTVNLTARNVNGTNSTFVNITVLKATPTITWDDPDDIVYGTALDVTQLNATSPVPGNFTYDPDVGTVLGAGNDQELTAEFTPDDATNYTTVSANVSINVTSDTPVITWSNPDDIVYGTTLNDTQLNANASVEGLFGYTPDNGTVLGVGQHTLHADFTPTDAANYTNVSENVTINVTSDTPVITWSNPDDIVYGTTLNDTQLNANASVEGLFGYTPDNGTVLGVGQHTLQADFTPTDAANYTNVSENVTINVTSDTPVITWSNPQDIVYGTTLNDTQLNANASVEGLFGYTPDNGTVLGVGQHTLQADFTPTDAANYTNVSENVTINVTSDTPVITWSNPDDIVYGTTLNDTQLNANASVEGLFGYTPDNGTVLGVGQHTLHADFTPTDAANYTNVSENVTINVTSDTPVITWSNPDDIVYGIALNDTQLNANASVEGLFGYTPDNGTVLGVGQHTLQADFTPTDAANYTNVSENVTINVTSDTPVITWSNPDDIVYGIALNDTQLNANASVEGLFGYTPDNGTVLGVGQHTLQADFTPTDAANYTNVSENVTINVTSDTPVITWSNPDDIVYGTTLNDTQLNANASVEGLFGYTPDNGTVLGVGQHTLQADFTPTDAANYTNVSENVTINVTSDTPVITWSNPQDIVYGTTLNDTQLNANASVEGLFGYTPDNGTVLGVGQHTLHADFTPTDAANYTNVSENVTINVTSDTPVITWSNPDDIVYGTTLNDTQLNANASVEGLFGYTPDNGTVLGVGQHTLQADFTPTDAANYTNVSENVTINVTSDTPVITWSNPDDIVYGTTLNDTQLNANASVEGLFGYTPDNGTVLGVGQHTLHADFTPTDAANYTNVSENVTINVTSDTPVITWSNPDDIVYGTTLNDTQLNANASVEGLFGYTPDNGTVLGVGQHTLQADFTPTDAANYTNVSENVTINVTSDTPVITWSNPQDIVYGTTLNDTQLNANASVEGLFGYTPDNGTVLGVGQHTLHADFTPTDAANYTNVSENVTINVTSDTPVITWSNPDDIVYGTTLNDTQLNANASVEGLFGYTPDNGTVLGVGQHTLQVDFTPTDAANYTNVSENVTINVTSDTPVITWSNPQDIVYGTTLNDTQLNANASVEGLFGYTPDNGTVLGVGQHTLHADFTPTDAANYTNVSENVTINVTSDTPVITWSNPDDIVYGTTLNDTQLNANASVEGLFGYTPDNGTVLGVGQHTLQADFTPTDAANYTNVSENVTINVTSDTPVITWSNPQDIVYGTTLNDTQLNANASVEGLFGYTPDNGTVLGVGQHTLHADFTPTDAANYTNVSENVTINVTSDTPVITWSNPDDIVYGTTLNDTQLNANASVEGLFGYTPDNGTVLGVGQHTLQADFTPTDAANYTNVSENVTINVTSDTPVITWSNPQDIVYGTTLNDTQLNANASVEGLFGYTPDNGTVLGVGQHTLQADFTPTDAANYTNVSENVTINVTSDTPVITWSNPADIVYGTALNGTQLNATASVNGNFTYDPTTGTVLDVGQHTLRVDLTPADAANYTNASKNVTITVLEQPGLVANLYLSINALESKHPGSSMNYTLYYQNFGNKTAQNVVLEDVLSSDVEFESASDGGIYNNSTRTVRWDIGSVAPTEYGYRVVTVEIPLNVTNGTVIYNNASINASDTESRYDDNEINIQTLVASQNLPENVSVEPTIGDAGIPSVYWGEPITFSYHTCDSATGVNISIHIDDGQPDIVENMTGGPSDWNYTTTFYPRTGKATVNYTVYGCNQSPVSFNLYIDPAGYIYDIETGNRIANASVWLQRPDGNENWENVPTGQNPAISQPDTNPLITNNDGMYQWDVLNGTYRVHVEATGYEPQNSYAVTVPPAVTDLHVGLIRIPEANYSIFKSVIDPDPTGDCIINKDGDKVPYRIVVKNEGEVNLTNVAVDDTLISPLPEPTGDDNNDSILNPGEIWIYEAIYTLTSEDVENGSINNNATVTCDQLPGKSSSVNTTVDQNAELSIYKTVTGIDEAGDRIINEIGDIIQYQVAIKNNGNIDLTDVLVSDLMVNLTKKTGDRADSGVLNPGEIWVYAGNYSVTQEDIDRAKSGNALIENTASVSCNQLPNESSSLELPIIYIPPSPPIPPTPESENSKGLPVVNFSTNVTSGNAPLSVQFTDLSQNAISRSWDFNNDGSIDSTDTNPVYTYFTQGTYTVNLTVSNVNGSVSKIASIKVLQAASSGSGGNNDVSGGGESEGKAVIVRNDANSSTANTAAAANVSPTENNNGQSSTPANVEPTPVQTSTGTPAKESKKTPGFEPLCGITGLLVVYLYRRR